MRECSRVVNGLRFYVPDPMDGNALTAYEWSERSDSERDLSVVADEPDGVYLLTPAGELAVADRPVIDDDAWNAQCLAERKKLAHATASVVMNEDVE
jgi:hypothetical protein